MSALSQYTLFLVESITIVTAILVTVAGAIALSAKKSDDKKIIISSLNDKLDKERKRLLSKILDKKAFKALFKEEKKQEKSQKRKKTVYVIPFSGDLHANQVSSFREVIDLVLSVVKQGDEVVIKLESAGGTVNGYGLAASQIQRLRDAKVYVIACVDKVAASGGYLMAAAANKILAAPYAIIGSIGVVAQLPNFNRFLKKHDVDVELITAGDHKRTLTLFGENTEEDRDKFRENLKEIHHAFKESIMSSRPEVEIDKVATGDYWLASQALELNLIDGLSTSDEYLTSALANAQVFELSEEKKVSKIKKLIEGSQSAIHKLCQYLY